MNDRMAEWLNDNAFITVNIGGHEKNKQEIKHSFRTGPALPLRPEQQQQ